MKAKAEMRRLRAGMWVEQMMPLEAKIAVRMDEIEAGREGLAEEWWKVVKEGEIDPGMNRFMGILATERGNLRVLNGQWEHNETATQLVLDVARQMPEIRKAYEQASEILEASNATIQAVHGSGVRIGQQRMERSSKREWLSRLDEVERRVSEGSQEPLAQLSRQTKEEYKRRYGARRTRRLEVLQQRKGGVEWGRITDVAPGIRERILVAVERQGLAEEFNKRIVARMKEVLESLKFWGPCKVADYPGDRIPTVAAEVEPGRVSIIRIGCPTWVGIEEKGFQNLEGILEVGEREGVKEDILIAVVGMCGQGIEVRGRESVDVWDAEGCVAVAASTGQEGVVEQVGAATRELQRLLEDGVDVTWGPGTSVADIYGTWERNGQRIFPEWWNKDEPTFLMEEPNARWLLYAKRGERNASGQACLGSGPTRAIGYEVEEDVYLPEGSTLSDGRERVALRVGDKSFWIEATEGWSDPVYRTVRGLMEWIKQYEGSGESRIRDERRVTVSWEEGRTRVVSGPEGVRWIIGKD